MSENSNKGDIILIMDESGSMQSMGKEAPESAKLFIKEQQNIGIEGTQVSIWKFNHRVVKAVDEKPLTPTSDISFTYQPEGCTAMYDAIGKAITQKINSDRCDNNICLIITDGLDNSSREFKSLDVKKLIEIAEEKHKWKFVFVGANIDAWSVGGHIGFNNCMRFDATPIGINNVLRQTSNSIGRYRTGATAEIDCNCTEEKL